MNIAITGANGLVGSRVVELLKHDFTFIPLAHSEVDITDQKQAHKKLNNINFDLLLHLAAYTKVDGAESERDLAYKINVTGTKNLFETCQDLNKKFIYISTDFVFDGKNPPYDENSKPNPISYYGQTKYEGEKIVQGKAMIVRTSYPFKSQNNKKKDFVHTVKSLLETNREVVMVTDSQFTPTFIDDLANGLKNLLNNYQPQIYHLVGSQSLSPYHAGKLIAQYFQLNEELVKPTTYAQYFAGKAKRPQWSKMKTIFKKLKLKSFKDCLEKT